MSAEHVLQGASSLAALVLIWLAIAVALVGWGLTVARRAILAHLDSERLLDSFWTGFVAVVFAVQFWNLFLPVNGYATLVFFGGGLAGLVATNRQLLTWWKRVPTRRSPLVLLFGVFVVWAGHQALGLAGLADTGIYHAQAVRWASEYPVVPGVANLHPRLGFNGAGLTYSALFNNGPLAGRAAHFVNGPLVLALVVQGLVSLRRLFSSSPGVITPRLFDVLLLAPLVYLFFGEEARSLSTDLQGAVVLVAVGTRLFRLLVSSQESHRSPSYLVLLTGLFALAPTVKLSTAAFALAGWLIAMVIGLSRSTRKMPIFVLCTTVSVLIVGVWILRNIVMTGALAYPSASLLLPLDWAVPREQAAVEAAYISIAARWGWTYGLDSPPFWIQRLLNSASIHLMALPVTLALLAALARWKHVRSAFKTSWPFLVAVAAGLVFWVFTVPNPRFGWSTAWLGFAVTGASLLSQGFGEASRSRLAVLTACLVCAPIAATPGSYANLQSAVNQVAYLTMTVPPRAWFPAPLNDKIERSYRTSSGLQVSWPVDGYCWDSVLPCTPWPQPGLRLRKGESLRGGFVAGHVWEPETAFPRPGRRIRSYLMCAHGATPAQRESCAKEARAGESASRLRGFPGAGDVGRSARRSP